MPRTLTSAATLAHLLRGINFPAGKQRLLYQAQQNGGDCDVLNIIQQMPERDYASLDDVMLATGAR